jgi:hypothetical protein
MNPSEGDYTNQMEQAVPTAGGWVMKDYDNAKDYKDDGSSSGPGEVHMTHEGTFPQGPFTWSVVKKL